MWSKVKVTLLFHINQACHSWDTNLTLKIQGDRQHKGQNYCLHLKPCVQSISLFFISWQSDNFGRNLLIPYLTWNFKVKIMAKIKHSRLESTARRHLKSSRSLPSRTFKPHLVTKRSRLCVWLKVKVILLFHINAKANFQEKLTCNIYVFTIEIYEFDTNITAAALEQSQYLALFRASPVRIKVKNKYQMHTKERYWHLILDIYYPCKRWTSVKVFLWFYVLSNFGFTFYRISIHQLYFATR